MPLQATSGAASYDAFGGGVPFVPTYIEDVFQTWLYTGTGTSAGSTQTITNGIDLSGKGGMVWIKDRGIKDNFLFDTNRGIWKYLVSNATDAQPGVNEDALSAFNSNGFTLTGDNNVTQNGQNYASWTFRKQPKFFDVVTYTGTGANATIAHNLGSVPGCIIVKQTNTARSWQVYHRSLGATKYLELNGTAASNTDATEFRLTPDATSFYLGTSASVNQSGGTYVAYLFAHDAGGFGLTGTDNVISCGSYTGTGSTGNIQTLGYEPQFLLIKNSGASGGWAMLDNMRRIVALPDTNADSVLYANTSAAEDSSSGVAFLTATGFGLKGGPTDSNASGNTYIYIAIRRGPMKVPTTGTSVFGLSARTGTGANATVTGGAGVTDLAIIKNRGAVSDWVWVPRLASNRYLSSDSTNPDTAAATTILQSNPWDVMDGVKVGTTSNRTNASGNTFINYLIDRAPGFMDVCCYTGTGANRTVAHNLAAVPELMIAKNRSTLGSFNEWIVYHSALGETKAVKLNEATAADTYSGYWNNTSPTATQFTLGAPYSSSGATYVAYLFATCPGVSKVGSYTGNGSSQTINCGFTGGARFVMIKRTDSTGDWYVWDTARGIVSGNDPHLSLNTTAAEVTSNDTIDTDSTGFVVNQVSATNVNVSSATYIFMSVA